MTSYLLRSPNLQMVDTMPPSCSSSASALLARVSNAGVSQTMTLGLLSATQPQIKISPRCAVWVFQSVPPKMLVKRLFFDLGSRC